MIIMPVMSSILQVSGISDQKVTQLSRDGERHGWRQKEEWRKGNRDSTEGKTAL